VGIMLNVMQPDFAFFGQKDAQQAIVIKQMVRDLAFDTEIIIAPTVREETGLAMSSRNNYLSENERRAAAVLNRALSQAGEAFEEGERNAARLIEIVRTNIEKEPLVRIDYVSLNDAERLETLELLDEQPALLSLAAFVGKTRLIDNVVLGKARQDAAGAGDRDSRGRESAVSPRSVAIA
jgi:pantoate--beta-alanine ligase